MSETPARDEDGAWEAKKEGGGSSLPVILGVALGVGCIGLVCGGGILAAIAIPNFVAMQLRAKRSELPTNVDAIRTAEKAYHAEWDVFTTVEACPPEWISIGREAVVWDASWDCYSQFEHLGWMPDGMVRGRYQVTASNTGVSSTDDFKITAEADLDGDGENSVYTADRSSKAWMDSYNNVY